MPSASRARSATAVVDVQLADRATATGRYVSPGQVRRWRMAGLLPAPNSHGTRPKRAPIGRLPLNYEDAELPQLDAIVAILADHARPGRDAGRLALILFAYQLPVDPRLLQDAITTELLKLRDGMNDFIAVAVKRFPPPAEADLRQSDDFERAEALAKLVADGRSPLPSMRGNLRSAGRPVAKADMLSMMTRLIGAVFGGAELAGAEGEQDVEDLLHAFGAHGLIEPAGPGGPAVVPGGAATVLDAIEGVAGLAMQPLPGDVSTGELVAARDLCAGVGQALAAIPDPTLRHHLGGDLVVGFWDTADPAKIALTLNFFVQIRRHLSQQLDGAPIVDAVRAQGWLNEVPGRPGSGPAAGALSQAASASRDGTTASDIPITGLRVAGKVQVRGPE